MRSSKIKSVEVNFRKKAFEIKTKKGIFPFPFCFLALKPSKNDPIQKVYVDPEIENRGFTYVLTSGKEDTVLMDQILFVNKDPDYMRNHILYELTLEALKLLEVSGLSKREISRRLKTSPAQVYRLLDTTNYKKSTDEMLRLISSIGYEVDFEIKKKVA